MKKRFLFLTILFLQSTFLFSQTVTLVKDIIPGPVGSFPTLYSFNPSLAFEYNNQLYFIAYDANYDCGLWKSDGTDSGTVLVKDFTPGIDTCSGPFSMRIANNKLFITALSLTAGVELWISDGTTAGTVLLSDIRPGIQSSIPRNFATVGNELFFTADDMIHGREIWKSDGTNAGTVLVKDIIPGPPYSTGQGHLTPFNNYLVFTNDMQNGFCSYSDKLWISDGTDPGTHIIRDIDSVACTSNVSAIDVLDSVIYFRADSAGNYKLLWKSDGTAAGTQLFKKFSDSIPNSFANIYPVLFKDTLYFSTSWSPWVNGVGHLGSRIWKSNDGTGAGTSILSEALHNGLICDVSALIPATDYAYFMATFHSAATIFQRLYELWKTDGTTAGTTLVKSFGDSTMNILGIIDDIIYLGVDDSTISPQGYSFGTELWQSDGTAGGTFKIADIYPGHKGSSPSRLIKAGGVIFFSATDSIHGTELWRLDYNNISVEENSKIISLNITPNPATSYLNLSINAPRSQSIDINLYNPLGSRVYFSKEETTAGKFSKEINVKNLPNGIYFLEVKTKEGVVNKKVVVQH
ncbi:MAG TPA: ELWxxDGT repeat protein [Bacteroidia bacterium]|nr:ELWxxDGT repeat protein [Bacteroidia bacterium]